MRPTWKARAWCFDRAVSKKGYWARTMTVLFTVHIIALMYVFFFFFRKLKTYPSPNAISRSQTFRPQAVADNIRSKSFFSFVLNLRVHFLFVVNFFLGLSLIYVIDTLVRLAGLGFHSFRANGWNIFDTFVATGSFIATLNVRFGDTSFQASLLQKLFLVVIAFKLVQRSNSLNLLFKTAV